MINKLINLIKRKCFRNKKSKLRYMINIDEKEEFNMLRENESILMVTETNDIKRFNSIKELQEYESFKVDKDNKK